MGFVAVGKWETCFWFSTFPCACFRRSCGNVGISRCWRDFQGTVGRGEILLLDFHAFHRSAISTARFSLCCPPLRLDLSIAFSPWVAGLWRWAPVGLRRVYFHPGGGPPAGPGFFFGPNPGPPPPVSPPRFSSSHTPPLSRPGPYGLSPVFGIT